MNSRQRWINTLLFKDKDRIPLEPGHGRQSTRARWYREGLPSGTTGDAIIEYAYRQAGGKEPLPRPGPGFPVNERMIPEFDEKVIERGARTQIVQDWKGNICEISNEYDPTYLRNPIDFVTRRWIKCPVESRQDWEDMKRRYNPDDPNRLSADAKELGKRLKDRDYPIQVHFNGVFFQMREWLGFESLCMMFHDDTAFVREMIEFWTDYIAALLERTFECIIPDCIHISEDIAYKGFSMVSPRTCRQLLMPCWQKWGQLIRGAGVPIYAIDSDGYIGELIPIWIESGVNCCDPIEVAAGNNLSEFRKQFGKHMAYRGGVDKRLIAAGGAKIEAEIERLRPVINDGGFIPGCDHGVPHDISWPDFVYYARLLAEATGWL
ncbi:MAG: uroporphyrinogen decarboxylase/cobalamine-independent methonine synthase family protein [Planctomycetota bacterium]